MIDNSSRSDERSEFQQIREELREIKLIIVGMANNRSPDSSSLYLGCQHCGKANHSSDRCFKLTGYPNRSGRQVKRQQQVNVLKVKSDDEESIVELNESEMNKIEAQIREENDYSVIRDELAFIPLTIGDKLKVHALVDSGANVTAIDRKLCVENDIPMYKKKRNLVGATNSFISLGIAQLKVSSGDITTKIEALVIDLVKQKFILGKRDFASFNIKLQGPTLTSRRAPHQMPTINSLEGMSDDSRAQKAIDSLVDRYQDVFGQHDFHVGSCRLIKCRITVEPYAKPITARPRRLSLALQEEEKEQVQQLLDFKLTRPSFSSWASGITFAVREGKMPRLCGDYRYLNQKTISDQYPIPNIENIILQFKGAEVYSTLDIVRGYNHIEIEEADRFLTAFTTNVGLYEWNRMPFGLENAPFIFQRLMDRLLKAHELYARANFDDIIIFSKNYSDHLDHIEAVFKTLIAFNIKLKQSKCQFIRDNITFCGYQVTKNRISRDSKFTEAITKIQRPSNVAELQSFLGLANYGSRFVSNFAALCKPLNSLRKKGTTWDWTSEHEEAFDKLKTILSQTPQLQRWPLIFSLCASECSLCVA